MKMSEEDARHLYLVRAIEREDAEHVLLTAEDREQADMAARGEAGTGKPEKYLAARSRFAAARLATRHPAAARALKGMRWPGWLSLGLPIAALLLGVLTNELGNGNQLNLLAFPLIGAIAWNLAVYVVLIISSLLRSHDDDGALAKLARRLSGTAGLRKDAGSPMTRGLAGFAADWIAASSRLTAHRSARTFHIAAAFFAVGLIGGIFLRALAFEYRAGWESTFMGPQTVQWLLSMVLGPASAITGIAIPDVSGIAALRWAGAEGSGANAGPWIILYTATALMFIVMPRLVLAGLAAVRANYAARTIAIPGREDFYVRRLMRAIGGRVGAVRITTYAYRPEEDVKKKLEIILHEAIGDAAPIRFDPLVDYGAEETWLEGATARDEDEYHIALFTLSATPEDENHGEFVRGLRKLKDSIASVAVIVDESAFRAHFAGQSGLDERVATRSAAWRDVVSKAGITPLLIDIANADPAAGRERLEAALVQGGTLEGRR